MILVFYRLIGDRYLDNAVQAILEEMVSLLDLVQRETVGDEGRGVDLAFRDKLKYLRAVATVYAAGATIVTMALGRAQRQASWKVSSLPATSMTTSAPPWALSFLTNASQSSGLVTRTSG